jgi:hypothetical protein
MIIQISFSLIAPSIKPSKDSIFPIQNCPGYLSEPSPLPPQRVFYTSGGKFCRRCEFYFVTQKLFCQCCGMRLRGSPTAREYKEKVRAKKKLIDV